MTQISAFHVLWKSFEKILLPLKIELQSFFSVVILMVLLLAHADTVFDMTTAL